MHVELSNFEIRFISSSKIWRTVIVRRNNTGFVVHIRHELVPLLESNYSKIRRLDAFCHS